MSESVRVAQRRLDDMENVEDDEDKAQRCLGQEDINIQTKEQGNTCGFLYYEDRSTGTTLKQSTYQISWGFTTCACAIFMGQRNNNNDDPCGSWALSQWLTEQRGRGRRHQNKALRGPKEDGTESKRGAEQSMWSCDRVDQRWLGMMRVPESRAG